MSFILPSHSLKSGRAPPPYLIGAYLSFLSNMSSCTNYGAVSNIASLLNIGFRPNYYPFPNGTTATDCGTYSYQNPTVDLNIMSYEHFRVYSGARVA